MSKLPSRKVGVERPLTLETSWQALARLGVDASVVASWDSGLVRDARLLVPVDVQALVVPAGGGVAAVQTETVLDPGAAAPIAPPAPFGTETAREPGIHLHIAMPDGLTRGNAGSAGSATPAAGNPTQLPSLPDRWVVVRLPVGEETHRAWVLEADRGDHTDLAGWTDPGPAPAGTQTGASGRRYIESSALNAMAGGEPAWAATYDAVVDRFAFRDDLSDLVPPPGGLVSYFVAGWWSDPSLDPLHGVSTLSDYTARASALGWLAPEPDGLTETAQARAAAAERRLGLLASTPSGRAQASYSGVSFDVPTPDPLLLGPAGDGEPIQVARVPAAPSQTLLHGVVLGVPVDGSGPDLRPDATALQLAVGATPFGALAAMLASGTDAERDASERLLAAFASGQLATIDAPDGLVAADEARHARAFVSQGAGLRAQPDRLAQGDPLAPAGGATPTSSARPAQGGTSGRFRSARLIERDEYQVLASAHEKLRGSLGLAQNRAVRSYREVAVPEPRYFTPADVAFVLRGATRSYRHGWDGRFTADGLLACRLPSEVVDAQAGVLAGDQLPAALRTLGSGAIPPEIDLLLREAVLTDPYRLDDLTTWAQAANGLGASATKTRLVAELALRYRFEPDEEEVDVAARDMLRRASLTAGVDVSPVGWTRWSQPWVPLWCDWEVTLNVDAGFARWQLGEIDFQVRDGEKPAAASSQTVSGRTLLTSSSARALSGQIQSWLDDENSRDLAGQGQVDEADEALLAAAAAAAGGLDVLTGGFGGIRETLLGLDPVLGLSVPIDPDGNPTGKPAQVALPLLLAGGAATLTRLRLVDAFGRWLDLPDASLPAIEVAATNRHPDGAPNVLLPPRLQRPSRLWFRLVDPRADDGAVPAEARVDQQYPDQAVSPVAGWLLPDHVDGSLEFFDAAGTPLGQLLEDSLTGAVVWEGAPGRPGPIGAAPDPGTDPGARHLTRLAVGAIEADAAARAAGGESESALSALLRAIDTTLWTSDPLGSLGTSSVAGLIGRPVVVLRAELRFDVLDDVDALSYASADDEDARRRAYDELAMHAVAVRLGELTRTDDSLLAYAVADDYTRVLAVSPDVLTEARASGPMVGQLGVFGSGSAQSPAVSPITHPYLAADGAVAVNPGHTVSLTLLAAPGGKLHATAGVVPRKSVALARDWLHPGIDVLAPSFRIGPVLVPPATVRMPTITGLGSQEFTRRDTPLTWRDDPIVAATQAADFPDPPSLQEGWIRVVPADPTSGSGA